MSPFPSVWTLSRSGNEQEPAQHASWFSDVLTPTTVLDFRLSLFEKLLAFFFCHLCYSSGCCHLPWLSSQRQKSETTNPLNTSACQSREWKPRHSHLSLLERFLLRDRAGSVRTQPAVSSGAESPSPPLLDDLQQENITIKITVIQSCQYSPPFSITSLILRQIFLHKCEIFDVQTSSCLVD